MKKAIALLLALCLPLSCAAAEGRLLDNNRKELTLEEIRAIYQSVL